MRGSDFIPRIVISQPITVSDTHHGFDRSFMLLFQDLKGVWRRLTLAEISELVSTFVSAISAPKCDRNKIMGKKDGGGVQKPA